MNRNVLVFGVILSFVVSNGICQDNKKEIEKTFNNYLTSLIKQDFDEAVNYISDDFFKIIPKDQMILLLKKVFINNPEIEFEVKDPKILEINESEFIDNKYYSLLTYSNKMNVKFIKKNEIEETEEDYKLRIALIKVLLEQNFGLENVKYNDFTNSFEVYVEKKVCAISNNGMTDWKFIVLEEKQKVFLERLLPKKLLDKI